MFSALTQPAFSYFCCPLHCQIKLSINDLAKPSAAQRRPLNQTFRPVHAPRSIDVPCRVCIARELFLSSSFRQRSISFKLNQMNPIVMRVHVARLSQRKVLLLLRYGAVDLLVWSSSGSLLAERLAAAFWAVELV